MLWWALTKGYGSGTLRKHSRSIVRITAERSIPEFMLIPIYIYIYVVNLKHCETVKTRYKYTVLSVFEAQRHVRSCRVAPSSAFVAVKKTRALSRKTRCARTTCTRPECVFCGPNTWLTDVVYSNERWWEMTMDSVFCLSQDSKLNTCRRFAWRFACFCII